MMDTVNGGGEGDVYEEEEEEEELVITEDLFCETVAFDESMTISSSNGNVLSQCDSAHEYSSSNQNAESDRFHSGPVSSDEDEDVVLSDMSEAGGDEDDD